MRRKKAAASHSGKKTGPFQGQIDAPTSIPTTTSLPLDSEDSRPTTPASSFGLRSPEPVPRTEPADARQMPTGGASTPTDVYESDMLTLAQLILAGSLSVGMTRWMALYLRVQEAAFEGRRIAERDSAALASAARGTLAPPTIPDDQHSPLGRALRRKRSEPEVEASAISVATPTSSQQPSPGIVTSPQPKKAKQNEDSAHQPRAPTTASLAAQASPPEPTLATPRWAAREQPTYASVASATPQCASERPMAPPTPSTSRWVARAQPAYTSIAASSPTDQSEAGHTNMQPPVEYAEKARRRRFPPIVVERLPNWVAHFRQLVEMLGHTPNARPFGNGVRFIPQDPKEDQITREYLSSLEEQGVSWYSYSPPNERHLKIAIRGLPMSTPPDDIAEALEERGFNPVYVREINARRGRQGCVYHCALKKTPGLFPAIYEVTELLLMDVRIEGWRGKRGPAQCHRCQLFRHSSHHCHRPIACVRCGGPHPAHQCERPREEAATCANCKGPHPANDALRCPIYRREKRNRRAGTIIRTGDPGHKLCDPSQPATKPSSKPSTSRTGRETTQPPTPPERKTRILNVLRDIQERSHGNPEAIELCRALIKDYQQD